MGGQTMEMCLLPFTLFVVAVVDDVCHAFIALFQIHSLKHIIFFDVCSVFWFRKTSNASHRNYCVKRKKKNKITHVATVIEAARNFCDSIEYSRRVKR